MPTNLPPPSPSPPPSESEPTDTTSTWAARNPLKEIIPPRRNSQAVKSAAEKAALKIARDARRKDAEHLNEDVVDLLASIEHGIDTLASKHSQPRQRVEQMVLSTSRYVKKRAPSLTNALIHAKGREMNEARTDGKKHSLAEIRQAIKDDPAMQNLTEEQKDGYIQKVMDFRGLKHTGARAHNKASNLDVASVMKNIHEEVPVPTATIVLHFAFYFATRNHSLDTMIPTWMATEGILQFFVEVLGISGAELSKQFDAWNIARLKRGRIDTPGALQTNCRTIIHQGLNRLLNLKDVRMNYKNYDAEIRAKYKVQLRGWPLAVKFAAPSSIGGTEDLRALNQALISGECRWVKMSEKEVAAVEKVLKNQGPKVKAPRSDKGVPRKRKAGNQLEGSTKKKSRKAASMMPPKSKETISDSEDDEDGEGHEEEGM
ncbi:hypothetical protein DFP72DRAFT_1070675 [Ephemerocybe angulata]|uniref:Uncharacterized protein n=1 Tax=Ephemerocybe angulata TaxID=980116 RepID=A0A8H6HRR8_9AGAR|nr:hypothetical protein DFP72DRAFT_1070675 [Tulosesus angulatus]